MGGSNLELSPYTDSQHYRSKKEIFEVVGTDLAYEYAVTQSIRQIRKIRLIRDERGSDTLVLVRK